MVSFLTHKADFITTLYLYKMFLQKYNIPVSADDYAIVFIPSGVFSDARCYKQGNAVSDM